MMERALRDKASVLTNSGSSSVHRANLKGIEISGLFSNIIRLDSAKPFSRDTASDISWSTELSIASNRPRKKRKRCCDDEPGVGSELRAARWWSSQCCCSTGGRNTHVILFATTRRREKPPSFGRKLLRLIPPFSSCLVCFDDPEKIRPLNSCLLKKHLIQLLSKTGEKTITTIRIEKGKKQLNVSHDLWHMLKTEVT